MSQSISARVSNTDCISDTQEHTEIGYISNIELFRVADPGFKSRPEHPSSSSSFSYSTASFGFDFVSLGATRASAMLDRTVQPLY